MEIVKKANEVQLAKSGNIPLTGEILSNNISFCPEEGADCTAMIEICGGSVTH